MGWRLFSLLFILQPNGDAGDGYLDLTGYIPAHSPGWSHGHRGSTSIKLDRGMAMLLSGPAAGSLHGLRGAKLPLCSGVTVLTDANHSDLPLRIRGQRAQKHPFSGSPNDPEGITLTSRTGNFQRNVPARRERKMASSDEARSLGGRRARSGRPTLVGRVRLGVWPEPLSFFIFQNREGISSQFAEDFTLQGTFGIVIFSDLTVPPQNS